MAWVAVAFIVGCFVGWNFPQPEYAKKAQDWIKSKFN